tara:strand:- start:490 stop:729 length:240 start_codon:yes stop_codon:yes gene_type:complete
MNKYYVKSGNLAIIILGEDERDAIHNAVTLAAESESTAKDLFMDDFFYVNERGFDSMNDKDYTMHTEEVILDLLGWDWE